MPLQVMPSERVGSRKTLYPAVWGPARVTVTFSPDQTHVFKHPEVTPASILEEALFYVSRSEIASKS